MEKVIDLKDLLKHEVLDLYSAEEQIIEALPLMIEKAGNEKLKAALQDHLKVTEIQKSRLDEIKQLLAEQPAEGESSENERPGFFSRLFGEGDEKCKGMEGLIAEGKKMMAADMSPEAADAAIIGSAQKIEHYEISGYGTARAFARELNLTDVADRLEQTLNEEYRADDLLTELAVGKVNVEAEFAGSGENGMSESKSSKARPPRGSNGIIQNNKKNSTGKSGGKQTAAKKSSKATPSGSAAKPVLSKSKSPAKKSSSNSRSNNTAAARSTPAAKKGAPKKSAPKKSAPKKSAPKKSAPKKSAPKKTAAKKSVAKKSPAKKSPAKSSKSGNKQTPSKSKSSRAR